MLTKKVWRLLKCSFFFCLRLCCFFFFLFICAFFFVCLLLVFSTENAVPHPGVGVRHNNNDSNMLLMGGSRTTHTKKRMCTAPLKKKKKRNPVNFTEGPFSVYESLLTTCRVGKKDTSIMLDAFLKRRCTRFRDVNGNAHNKKKKEGRTCDFCLLFAVDSCFFFLSRFLHSR